MQRIYIRFLNIISKKNNKYYTNQTWGVFLQIGSNRDKKS